MRKSSFLSAVARSLLSDSTHASAIAFDFEFFEFSVSFPHGAD